MLTRGAFEDPELIKCSQWLDQFRTEYQRVIEMTFGMIPPLFVPISTLPERGVKRGV
jgi:hypothetical protein